MHVLLSYNCVLTGVKCTDMLCYVTMHYEQTIMLTLSVINTVQQMCVNWLYLPVCQCILILLANVNYVTFAICYRRSVCHLSVCLSSVTLVHPTQPVEIFGNFSSPYDSQGTLVFSCQNSLVGDAPFPLKFAFKVTHPFQTAKFRPISALSASTVLAKKVQLALIGIRPPAFQRAIDEPCTLPLSPPHLYSAIWS